MSKEVRKSSFTHTQTYTHIVSNVNNTLIRIPKSHILFGIHCLALKRNRNKQSRKFSGNRKSELRPIK